VARNLTDVLLPRCGVDDFAHQRAPGQWRGRCARAPGRYTRAAGFAELFFARTRDRRPRLRSAPGPAGNGTPALVGDHVAGLVVRSLGRGLVYVGMYSQTRSSSES